MNIQNLKNIADQKYNLLLPNNLIEEAILIRAVEQKFLDLFSLGKMNGTVHTCVGQEFSATCIAGQLTENDWVTSNHRCHGHFISKTKNWKGLVDELMGLETGVCKGIGSSQHLYAPGFFSNGPQGALIPVGTGIALHKKINNANGIVASFIGEGTLGEGVIYESMNLASLYKVPHLFICENNFYSQSTSQDDAVAGSIALRAEAFGIKVFTAHTWNPMGLYETANSAISYVRRGIPAFLLVHTYRLNPHSKGDDNRDSEELEYFRSKDPLTNILKNEAWAQFEKNINIKIEAHILDTPKNILQTTNYLVDQLPRIKSSRLGAVKNDNLRMVQALNNAYRQSLHNNAFHLGEDIKDPYGGAFKVTKGLSTDYPMLVKNTPISESGIVGIAIGMSIMGTITFAEIMFGDFMTHSFDQLLSNASKMHHMYAFQVDVPVRIRTPMGGKRGYGPTHSQSLEKFFLGIDNVGVIALTSLLDPSQSISDSIQTKCPLIILENKTDYSKFLWQEDENFQLRRELKIFGSLILSPIDIKPTLSIVSYGETARHIADHLKSFFIETNHIPELITLVQLHPLDLSLIQRSVRKTRKILIVEDGSIEFGIGAEILSRLTEKGVQLDFAKRIGASPVPIPSVSSIEMEILPTIKKIFFEMRGS